ncbi:hypothetical protein Acr_19g0004800 [Actinidia rufa]|uniref:Uncharacterized protein n=1 Tax=Actinidia rufa TaxID=165716 RepID=A0A7J0G9T7_9ERIC|nr:hypothetical protein Acr_19g0004800 [Actinidia rufa]
MASSMKAQVLLPYSAFIVLSLMLVLSSSSRLPRQIPSAKIGDSPIPRLRKPSLDELKLELECYGRRSAAVVVDAAESKRAAPDGPDPQHHL